MPRICPLLLLFACLPAFAGNWKLVADDKNTRVEIDVASLMRSDDVVKAWERETHLKPEQAKPGDFFFTMAKTLAQHNCTERSTTYLYRAYFAADGSEIKTLTTSSDLGKVDFLVPDSLDERKLVFACTYKPAAKKPDTALTPPEPTETEPPASASKPTPNQPGDKSAQKKTTPAKSAAKGDKSPVKSEMAEKTQPSAPTQPTPKPTEKTPAGK